MGKLIVSFGEVLWDALPRGLFLGGATFNVACHLHQMGRPVRFISRVGDDELGREIRRRMKRLGMADALVQTDPRLATGFVVVTLDEEGSPSFEILHPSAWDAIEATQDAREAVRGGAAFVFGTLGQRDPRSRATFRTLAADATFRVYDVNLRPPFDDRAIVEESLHLAHVVKMNQDELARITRWLGIVSGTQEGMRELGVRFELQTMCVTRGAHGAILLHQGELVEHGGFAVRVADAVGSGDAFLAVLLDSLLTADVSAAEMLRRANAAGAHVATQDGATPRFDAATLTTLIEQYEGVHR